MRTEVRIGNLVTDEFYDTFKKEIIVDSINQEGINLTAGDDGKPYGMHHGTIEVEYEFEKLRGIPLTEDWLKRFGFPRSDSIGKSPSFFYFYVGGSELHINPDNGVVWIERNDNVFNNPALVKYVHQLQNLYFALTGEELKLN